MDKKEVVIKFEHVTKTYKLFKSEKRRLLYTFCKKIKYKEKKAVNDVSFEIRRGESVALFGKNGAGDAALLARIGKEVGVDVITVPFVRYEGEKVSSTALFNHFPEIHDHNLI